jgi:hypothetical protein
MVLDRYEKSFLAVIDSISELASKLDQETNAKDKIA